MPDDEQNWFVYDMDGVITSRNCLVLYLRRRVLTHPLRAIAAAPDRLRLLLSRDENVRVGMALALAESALHGLSMQQYQRSAQRYGRRLADRRRFVRSEMVARIQGQRRAGAHIVIATACERTLAEAVLAEAKVPYELLSATTFANGPHGIMVDDARFADRKLSALRELGVPMERAHFHTDAISDHPTARRSARVTLVGASRWTIRRFRDSGIGVAVHDGDE